jgi:hypothetical protein
MQADEGAAYGAHPSDPEATRKLAEELRSVLRRDLAEIGWAPTGAIDLASRWEGGELVLRPGKPGLQEKAIPIESFFRKIVLARERLRVLEQKINNHPRLDDADRLELHRYLTQIYGSFTTFNVLFAERTDWFVGQRSDR